MPIKLMNRYYKMTQILIIGGMVYLSIVDNFYFGQLPYGYNFLFRDVLANIVYILFYYISLLYINKKTYKDSKLTFHNFRIKEPIIQLFLFMLIFANAFSLFDYAYYYGKIYYPTILLLAIIITLGLVAFKANEHVFSRLGFYTFCGYFKAQVVS